MYIKDNHKLYLYNTTFFTKCKYVINYDKESGFSGLFGLFGSSSNNVSKNIKQFFKLIQDPLSGITDKKGALNLAEQLGAYLNFSKIVKK